MGLSVLQEDGGVTRWRSREDSLLVWLTMGQSDATVCLWAGATPEA
jgi:hypothetical protein